MSRYVRCEKVTLSDGSVAFVRSAGPLTEFDRAAIEAFNEFLKCQNCAQRHKCALYGCWEEMDDAAQKGPEQKGDQ